MFYSTLIRKRGGRLPEDSGVWSPAPRPFRKLPVADNFDSRDESPAPVVMAWLLVLTAYTVPFALLEDMAQIAAVISAGLLVPALGTLWISQFRPVKARETAIRSVLWALSGMAIFAALTGHVYAAVALVPLYIGFGLLGALLINCLLNPRNE